jgi:hypothetical protein
MLRPYCIELSNHEHWKSGDWIARKPPLSHRRTTLFTCRRQKAQTLLQSKIAPRALLYGAQTPSVGVGQYLEIPSETGFGARHPYSDLPNHKVDVTNYVKEVVYPAEGSSTAYPMMTELKFQHSGANMTKPPSSPSRRIPFCVKCRPLYPRNDLAPSTVMGAIGFDLQSSGYTFFGNLAGLSERCERCTLVRNSVLKFASMFRKQVEPANISFHCSSETKSEFGLPTDVSFNFEDMPWMSSIALHVAPTDGELWVHCTRCKALMLYQIILDEVPLSKPKLWTLSQSYRGGSETVTKATSRSAYQVTVLAYPHDYFKSAPIRFDLFKRKIFKVLRRI